MDHLQLEFVLRKQLTLFRPIIKCCYSLFFSMVKMSYRISSSSLSVFVVIAFLFSYFNQMRNGLRVAVCVPCIGHSWGGNEKLVISSPRLTNARFLANAIQYTWYYKCPSQWWCSQFGYLPFLPNGGFLASEEATGAVWISIVLAVSTTFWLMCS